jgi:transposase
MFIARSKFKTKSGKIYQSILLRQSYRENGKVKKRTIANLSNCSPEELQAIELAFAHKHDLNDFSFSETTNIKEGLSFGSAWVIYQTAKKLGITEALGDDQNSKLALWQVIARVLEQGSRLSAIRLSETYALKSIINIEKGFTEDDLYKNLFWLAKNQEEIENKLFKIQKHDSELFLYDVTSSYLEGMKNELADWGYNRDGKKGKKQIVVGLLCDKDGNAISTQVFKGNTNDTVTFTAQIEKTKARFNCKNVTYVGDRGMIKSGQIEDLSKHGFHYITAITKKQIETLVEKKVMQYELFDEKVCEISENDIRYIFRRNPIRAQEIEISRNDKKNTIEKLIEEENEYLSKHPKAKTSTALKHVETKIKILKTQKWLSVKNEDRKLILVLDEIALKNESILDGCYVLKTDLKKEVEAQIIHDRYKDLAFVESAFRTCKSNLEIRPIYVRSEMSTYGHVLVVMLAYMIMKELDKTWSKLYLTVEEGLRSLSTLTTQEITVKDNYTFQRIPEPRDQNKKMIEALKIELPKILPKNDLLVVTRKSRRKSAVIN